MNSEKNTSVVTVLGKDRVGIIADVSRLLADYGININDISQTILDDIFTMVMMVDLKDLVIEESDISDKLSELGQKLGVQITIQHTGLFNAMRSTRSADMQESSLRQANLSARSMVFRSFTRESP